jgi:hypothetical protein
MNATGTILLDASSFVLAGLAIVISLLWLRLLIITRLRLCQVHEELNRVLGEETHPSSRR